MRCLRLRGRAVHMWHAGKRSPRACVNAQVCMCLIMTLIVPAFAGAILWPRGGFSSRCHRRRHVHVLGSHVSISSSQSAVRGAPGRRCTSPSVHTLHSPACRNYSRGIMGVQVSARSPRTSLGPGGQRRWHRRFEGVQPNDVSGYVSAGYDFTTGNRKLAGAYRDLLCD